MSGKHKAFRGNSVSAGTEAVFHVILCAFAILLPMTGIPFGDLR